MLHRSLVDRNEKVKLAEADVEETLTLSSRDGKAIGSAFMFIVTDAAPVDESLRSYEWYKALVLAGAREHNLPAECIHPIEGVESIEDPNKKRDRVFVGYCSRSRRKSPNWRCHPAGQDS